MGVEYYLVCIREGLLCGKGVEPPRGRGKLSAARESQPFFWEYFNKNVFKDIGSGYLLSIYRAYIYMFGWLCRATCCSVLSTSMLGISHAVQIEKLWMVLGLLVVYKIPYSSCMFNTTIVLEPGKM